VEIKTLEQYERLIKIQKHQDKIFSDYGEFFAFDSSMEDPIEYYVICLCRQKITYDCKRIGPENVYINVFFRMYGNFTIDNLKEDCKLFPLDSGAILASSQVFYDNLAGWNGVSLGSTNLGKLLSEISLTYFY
jgi:hypothetical protein